MNDNQPDTSPQPPIGFCQTCGKPLDSETIRKVGPAVYCEPCLAERISSPPPPPGYTPVNSGAPPTWPNPSPSSSPNPGLAALLGLIPGVGAMYNEQYAKGVVHLIIFAVLVMFSHISLIFGLFIMGWIAYMAIEAHHTAQARRDGTPLPNPFGLNDIGERMGFGAAWPSADPAAAARDAVNTAAETINTAAAGFNPRTPPPTNQPPANPYTQPYSYTYNYTYPNPMPPYTAPPYTPVSTAVPPYVPPLVPPSRFPAGAVWLIGLGVFFLLSTMGLFHALPSTSLAGIFLIALGVWLFLRRMTDSGLPFVDDGSSSYQFRLVRALRGSLWLIAIGILMLLDAFRFIRWSHSWPIFIILIGVMMLIQRTIYNSAAAAYYRPQPIIPPAPQAASTEPTPTAEAPHEGGN